MLSKVRLAKGIHIMRKTFSPFIIAFFVAALFAVLARPAIAQDDPPGRVARLNYIQGSVSYQVSGSQDWVQADPNRPLTTGDNLWADKDSRGEVHIGSTAIRMSSETGVSFLTLDDRTVQLQLAQGTIEVHLRIFPTGDAFEIDTPNLAFTVTRPGEYRIQTDPNGDSTLITVREGGGEVTGGGGNSWDLQAGQQYAFNGTDELTYDAQAAPGYDDFEDWCQSRDQRENSSASARYVSRDIDGYYDLDDYGDWHNDPDYGAVWVPRGVAVGWAPYHVGHWVYVAPWGWTWVDEEPWGFAPFHYGRWAFVGGYWGWVPGPVVVRPVYAPALVGFVGGGFGVGVAFGGGFSGVAWFPLGPRDVFVPGYHCSPRYVQNINITNTRVINVAQVTNVYNNVYVNHDTRIANNYTYAHNTVAVTAVSRDTFVNARSVGRASVRVTGEQIQGARVVDNAPIAPTRTSYISATAKVTNARPAVGFAQRPVVAKLNPAVSRPAPVYTNDSRQFKQQGTQQGAPQGGNRATQPSNNGFRPFQPPAGSTNAQAPAGNKNGNANNTQAFGGNKNATTNNNNQAPAGNKNASAGNTKPFGQSGNNAQQQVQPANEQPRPTMRYAQPQKARDDMYDVHPPLNQKQAQPPPKQEERRTEAPPRTQEHKEDKKDDKKDDKH